MVGIPDEPVVVVDVVAVAACRCGHSARQWPRRPQILQFEFMILSCSDLLPLPDDWNALPLLKPLAEKPPFPLGLKLVELLEVAQNPRLRDFSASLLRAS